MTIANPQASSALPGSRRTLITGAAGLLILVGLVLQLGALSYSHLQPSNIWVVSTVLRSAWSMLILQLHAQGMQAVLTFWPLLLVSLGLAIMLLSRSEIRQPLLSPSRRGQNHVQ
jgi:hypothetical protein